MTTESVLEPLRRLEDDAEALARTLTPDGWVLRTYEQEPVLVGDGTRRASPWVATADRQSPVPRLDEDPANYTAHYGAETRAGALLHVAGILADRAARSETTR